MGRTVKVVILTTVVSLLAASMALAVTKRCDGGGCRGTVNADKLYGTPGFACVS